MCSSKEQAAGTCSSMTTHACRGASEAMQTYVKYAHKTALLCAGWDKYETNYRWAVKAELNHTMPHHMP